MDLRLYDSKTAELQLLQPIEEGRVGIYLCGPTVQGSPHIGHLRAAASFDVLIRWLKRHGLDVTYVRNVTDIDDKILMKAEESDENWWALAQRYEREFQDAYATLGLVEPTIEPRATGHITDQIALIDRLIERDHAYSDGAGSVYFDVSSQPDYGSLTHQNPDDMLEGAEEDSTPGKRDPRDFALWKATKLGEPDTASWPSPWGRGRPGWHLECSAMSHRYLGEAFDIHGGGIDLRFPHHENEQAQSHAAGYDFANLWIHNAWVTIAGDKMSKSVGNTLDLQSLLEQAPAPVIRFALSSVHHRSTIEWGPRTLELAGKAWTRLSTFVDEATAYVVGSGGLGTLQVDPDQLTPDQLPEAFSAAINDDLNVAGALAVIYEHVKSGRRAVTAGDPVSVAEELLLVRSMLDVLGLDPLAENWAALGGGQNVGESSAFTDLLGAIVTQRQNAREKKQWEIADWLRGLISDANLDLKDGPAGKWEVFGADGKLVLSSETMVEYADAESTAQNEGQTE